MKTVEEHVGQCSALFWIQGEKRGSEGGRNVISQMGTLPKMFLIQKAVIFEAIPALTLCWPAPAIQGNSKGLDQKWDGVMWPRWCE